jgi:hypothetical protein
VSLRPAQATFSSTNIAKSFRTESSSGGYGYLVRSTPLPGLVSRGTAASEKALPKAMHSSKRFS